MANLLVPYLASYNGSGGGGTTGGGGGTTTTAPAAPANFTAVAVSTSQVNLSWTASSGATGYNVYEFEGGQGVLLGSVSSSTTSASVTGLTAGATYSFEVAAYNSARSSKQAHGYRSRHFCQWQSSAPTNVQLVAQSSTSVKVSWNASSGATGYNVYEWTGTQALEVASLGAGSTSTTISGLTPGSTDYFYVAAYNATSSAASAWSSIVMPTSQVLLAPTNVVVVATSPTTAHLSWSPSVGATEYMIVYDGNSELFSLGTVGASVTSVNISGLTPGSINAFLVIAINSTSEAYSNWVILQSPSLTQVRTNAATLADLVFSSGQGKDKHWVL